MDANEQLRALLSTLPIALWAIDREGLITLSEGNLLRKLDLQPGQLVGQSIFSLYKDLPEFIDVTHRALRGEAVSWQGKIEGVIFDGWYTPERDESGTVSGAIGVATDVTERVNIEHQMRQSQKMEAIGRLAGGIAHDFNNLLTAIVGFADLTINGLPADHPCLPDVHEIAAAARSAGSLTQQLLAFSRQQPMEPQPLDLSAVVCKMRALVSRLIGEDIVIEWRLAARLDVVNADPGQIQQVVMNLAVNARDAMPNGGTLTITTTNAVLDGRYAMLEIADTGVGMDDSVKEHLFEPFYTTKAAGKGTGLGLATVYGIVKQSGGAIQVSSKSGRGTAVRIFLPHVDAPVRSSSAVRQHATEALCGTETILVVEDQREVRSVAAETLRRWGYQVIDVPNGAQALEVGRVRGHIDLLLTDAVMPGMSGHQLAERLLAERPALRILIMSGYLHHGFAQLHKPFAPDTLLRKVRQVLDGPAHAKRRVTDR
ncbi:MAG TPA: ATP-binding protein [Vicinamibacterales bacterium]|jgi:two-component system, cell cycle sensor histidine kinase and response regulator CckA|nr:ATP-binding protein [Vicinamibacterales bacterium]